MKTPIYPGDSISALGYTFDVWTILYQDSLAGLYDVEFLDSTGRYHHWKENQDGGHVIREGIPGDYFRDSANVNHIATVREARTPGTYSARIISRGGTEEYLGRYSTKEAAAKRIQDHGRAYGITWTRM